MLWWGKAELCGYTGCCKAKLGPGFESQYGFLGDYLLSNREVSKFEYTLCKVTNTNAFA